MSSDKVPLAALALSINLTVLASLCGLMVVYTSGDRSSKGPRLNSRTIKKIEIPTNGYSLSWRGGQRAKSGRATELVLSIF